MKRNSLPFRRSRRGFALVLIMLTLMLVTALAVLFLASVSNERRGVDIYARGSQIKSLSDMAVNVVIGEINTATKEGTSATPVLWASQPGMIRTYGTDGGLRNAYRLYSWDNPVALGATFNPNDPLELPPVNWPVQTAQYVDLNQPTSNIYPIVDPNAIGLVDSFGIDQTNTVVSAAPASTGTTSAKAPMPVRWLYVLQDGTRVVPGPGPNSTSASVAGATATNPIVGRIAYWTDDETSKVNINTASEGTYWDTPKAGTQDDMQLAANPPAQGEFQRISGHPATTSLSAVFPEMRTTFNRWSNVGTPGNPNSYQGQLKNIYDMTPRIAWSLGGSQGGTFPINNYLATYAPKQSDYPLYTNPDPNTYKITNDTDRLYASPDDLWFKPDRTANDAFGNYGISAQKMAQRLFFLTTNSRAPETTLFDTPRVSLWPITLPNPKSTFYITSGRPQPTSTVAPQEKLLAFCSTLNVGAVGTEQPYYFQRQNPDSPSNDWLNIPRNQDLVKYIRREIDARAPGMGSSLASKWGSDNSDWISLNCFDYSRSLINQYTPNQAGLKLQYSYTAVQDSNYTETNSYTVTPLRVALAGQTYITEGSYPALKEVAIVFYATERQEPIPPNPPTAANVLNPDKWQNLINWNDLTQTGQSQTKKMRAVMLFSFAQMNPGIYGYRGTTNYAPLFWIKVTGSSCSVNGAAINLPSATCNSVRWGAHVANGNLQPAWISLWDKISTTTPLAKSFVNTQVDYKTWCLISNEIPVQPTDTTFNFQGGVLQVDIYGPDPSGNLAIDPTTKPECLVSRQQVDFTKWTSLLSGIGPGHQLPIPLAPRWNVRQAAMKWASQPAAPTATEPVTEGVLMPDIAKTSATFPNWKIEMVPALSQLGVRSGSPPQGPFLYGDDQRSSTNLAAGQSTGAPTNSPDPLDYAYIDSLGHKQSTDFGNRVLALYKPSMFAETTTSDVTPVPAAGASGWIFNGSQPATGIQGFQLITPYDTVISMVADPAAATAADPRLMGRGLATPEGSMPFVRIDQAFVAGEKPVTVIMSTTPRTTKNAQWHELGYPSTTPQVTGYKPMPTFGTAAFALRGSQTQRSTWPAASGFLVGRDNDDSDLGVESSVRLSLDPNWDFTSLPGNFFDGGYLARPDQEYQVMVPASLNGLPGFYVPYFVDLGLTSTYNGVNLTANSFVPNRQVPSPVILGTLPSDMKKGWQTLAFSPNPAAVINGVTHPGVGVLNAPSPKNAPYLTVPDHLLLDLFWMPVAEPYPISEQFSTAGKVNLNYAIMPFSYIQRKTALDAVLRSVWITALPSPSINPSFAKYYKSFGALYNDTLKSNNNKTLTRYPISVNETLKAFDYKFQNGDIFRSASQICDIFLIPNSGYPSNDPKAPLVGWDSSNNPIKNWWSGQKLTADNSREDPYSAIYSRVTTKSNSYTVHWRVQTLRKPTNSDQAVWNEKPELIAGELRGSTLIERYLDPNADDIPDYAADTSNRATPLSQFYKWRIASDTYFQP